MNEIVIHEIYDLDNSGEGVRQSVKDMKQLSSDELRLWMIQELACPDSKCWWLIDIGIHILKQKMKEQNWVR